MVPILALREANLKWRPGVISRALRPQWRHATLVACAWAACCWTTPALSQWTSGGQPIAAVPAAQFDLRGIGGQYGAYFTWIDTRSPSSTDVWTQHCLGSGLRDYLWDAVGFPAHPDTGTSTYATSNAEQAVALTPDGQLLVSFSRSTQSATGKDIYAERQSRLGGLLWSPVAVGVASGDQEHSSIASDELGGCFVTWLDKGTDSQGDIRVQHVLANGTIDGAWPSSGVIVASGSRPQTNPQVVSDGAGGAYVVWNEPLPGNDLNIYTLRLASDGSTFAGFPTAVTARQGAQDRFIAIGDGANGIIVAWVDIGSGVTMEDIYAQRIRSIGIEAWATGGVSVSSATERQINLTAAPVPAGGIFLAWQDLRNLASVGSDIYAARLDSTGVMAAGFPVDGTALCAAAGNQSAPSLAVTNGGNAVVAWADDRNYATTQTDIYYSVITGSGTIPLSLPSNGASLCSSATIQDSPVTVLRGNGGALVGWRDARTPFYNADMYFTAVGEAGDAGPLVGVSPNGVRPLAFTIAPRALNEDIVLAATSTSIVAGGLQVEVFDLLGRCTFRSRHPGEAGPRIRLALDEVTPTGAGFMHIRLTGGFGEQLLRFPFHR